MKRPSFSLFDAFSTCDLNDNGSITKDELRRLLESRGFYVSEKEVNCLVDKIDKDKDGRISYSEVSAFEQYNYDEPNFQQLSLS